jgi:translation initiation factor IF-3
MNEEITGAEVRLIDENGTMMGVMSPREALGIAEARGFDLIEIAPNAKPPTCKIMDYGKWKYENKQKEKAAKKKQTVITVKEVQMRPRTDQHDIDVKMRHARRFLLDGDKVKLNLRFSGREMAHQEIGLKLLNECAKLLEDIAVIETRPKLEGRQMFVLLSPDPVKVRDFLKNNQKPEVKPEELEKTT